MSKVNKIIKRIEQDIAYRLFDKKRLYDIAGGYDNKEWCPPKLRLFLTSEYCNLSKVIPNNENIKFIIMNPALSAQYMLRYLDIFTNFFKHINAYTWLCIINNKPKLNIMSEIDFINLWLEVNPDVEWYTCIKEPIKVFTYLTLNNILKIPIEALIEKIPEFSILKNKAICDYYHKKQLKYLSIV